MNLNKVTFTLLVSLLMTFLFVTAASACSLNDEYIMEINIDEQNINIADHSDSATEGNWISLSGGSSFSLPSPLTFTYNGVNYTETTINERNINVSLNVDNFTDYVITYPYATHQMYTNVSGLNNVEIEFSGSDYFAEEKVDVYLFNSTISDVKQTMLDLLEGDTSSLNGMFNSVMQLSEGVALDSNGDMSMDYGTLDAGSYCVLIILPDENVLLSATAFEVLDYNSDVVVSSESENVTLDVQLENAPATTYTYGAILVKESEYKADVRVEFDGTKDGFNSSVNGHLVVDGFDLIGMELNDMHKSNVSDLLTDIYGSDNISIVYSTVPFSNASLLLDTSDLSSGDYILFTGAMSDHDMVAFDEKKGSVSNGQFQLAT
ncbi:TIGR04279 domain-containing protein [Methanococcoides vulcani]|uniref:TIGR04279 domain-containing protein n=1 Tax=Methanococcoides vulcani TaxID=1353158 RepID=UPI000B85E23A|nr:TIGR04279 domain-containing protein [Methanococcoides vulcani]